MNIVKNVEFEGSKVVSTNNGAIALNQATGELVIRRNGNVMTKIDDRGFVYSEPNGIRRILIGAHPKDGHIIEAISDPGIDVINELNGTDDI